MSMPTRFAVTPRADELIEIRLAFDDRRRRWVSA